MPFLEGKSISSEFGRDCLYLFTERFHLFKEMRVIGGEAPQRLSHGAKPFREVRQIGLCITDRGHAIPFC